MKPRSCNITVTISNDAAAVSFYSLRPVAAAELGQSAAAFRLVNASRTPSPVYVVRLAVDGQASCNCPAHNRAGRCKHADALLAAGVLPSQLVALLQTRTKLLDEAEAMLKATEGKLDAVSARCVQLQTALAAIPARFPRKRKPAPPAEPQAA